MDPRLAEIYGTNEDISDVEKTAAAELAEKLAEEGEMDIDGMNDDDIEALAQEVLSSNEESEDADETEEEEKTASDETEGDETEEKLAEADYIGRVMAHAYVQELKSIDKEAGERMDKAKAKLKEFGGKVKAFGGKAKEHAGKAYGKAKEHAGKAGAFAVKHKKPLAIGGAAALAAGGGAMAYRHHKNKKSEATPALDLLAQQRALEILAENGVDVNEKQAESDEASKWDVLSQAVEAKAMEMLQAEGYEFEGSDEE